MSCSCGNARIFVGEQVLVQVDGYFNNATGEFNNTASFTFAVQNIYGDVVADGTGSLNYVAASNGKFQGAILKTAAVTANNKYTVVITEATYGIVARPEFTPQ